MVESMGDGLSQCKCGLESAVARAQVLASYAGLLAGSSSVSFLALAEEHPTQSISRCHFEQRQAPAEGVLTAAKTCLAQRWVTVWLPAGHWAGVLWFSDCLLLLQSFAVLSLPPSFF